MSLLWNNLSYIRPPLPWHNFTISLVLLAVHLQNDHLTILTLHVSDQLTSCSYAFGPVYFFVCFSVLLISVECLFVINRLALCCASLCVLEHAWMWLEFFFSVLFFFIQVAGIENFRNKKGMGTEVASLIDASVVANWL